MSGHAQCGQMRSWLTILFLRFYKANALLDMGYATEVAALIRVFGYSNFAVSVRYTSQFPPVREAELRVRAVQVALYCRDRDVQLLCHFGVGQVPTDKQCHAVLRAREAVLARPSARTAPPSPPSIRDRIFQCERLRTSGTAHRLGRRRRRYVRGGPSRPGGRNRLQKDELGLPARPLPPVLKAKHKVDQKLQVAGWRPSTPVLLR
jgi:hypothetical protein